MPEVPHLVAAEVEAAGVVAATRSRRPSTRYEAGGSATPYRERRGQSMWNQRESPGLPRQETQKDSTADKPPRLRPREAMPSTFRSLYRSRCHRSSTRT